MNRDSPTVGRDGGEPNRSGDGRRDRGGDRVLRVPDAPRSSDPDAACAPTPWVSRPVAALAIRSLAFIAPFAIAVGAAWSLSSLIPAAPTWELAFARIGVIVATTIALVLLTRRAVRRLGPLSALLRLSAAFPDDAPNRFRLAMQMPSARQLERNLKRGDTFGLPLAERNAAARIVALVTAISVHHPRTRGHSERVRAYADLIGQELGLGERDREQLRWAALLHDVGKLHVPVAILDKPARPGLAEWAVLAEHPATSAELTDPLRDWLGPWWSGIGEHHERWDGTGYPNRLRGNEISLAGRIVGVADSFETMTEVRSYKQAMPFAAAQQELVASAGTHFDPAIVRAFLAISMTRVRRASGWAAWLPAPIVEVVRSVMTSTWVAGKAGAAVTAAVSLLVPTVAHDVFEGPDRLDRATVVAAGRDHRASAPIAPPTIVMAAGPGAGSGTGSNHGSGDGSGAGAGPPAAPGDGPMDPSAITTTMTTTMTTTITTTMTTTTAPTVASPAATAPTSVPAATPTIGPAAATSTTSTVAVGRPPVAPTSATTTTATTTSTSTTITPPTTTTPSTTPTPPTPPTTITPSTTPTTTTPPTTPTTTTPPTTPTTTTPPITPPPITAPPTPVTPPPEWVTTPVLGSQGQTIFASGIEVEGWGLPVSCRLWLVDVPGFVAADLPCSAFMSVLAPEPDTTYVVRVQARTSSGETSIVEATVTTGS